MKDLRFAQVSHEYLIEQVQRETASASTSQKLNFNHPVKELIWVFQKAVVATEQTTITTAEDATINVGTVATTMIISITQLELLKQAKMFRC